MSTPQEARLQAELDAARCEIDQLKRAVESHETVGRAVGVLMGLHRMPAESAFAALTRVSMDRNVRLRDVAEAVLTIVSTETDVPDLPAAAAALELLPHPE